MGAWGLESCSNDGCWDALYVGGVSNMSDAKQDEVTPCLNILAERDWCGKDEKFLGCVVWFLSHGLIVEKNHLEKAKEVAQALLDNKGYLDSWSPPEGRAENLRKEIKDIEDAMKNGGQGVEEHIPGLFEKIFKGEGAI